MKKYLSLLAAVGFSFFTSNGSATIITYTVNANQNPGSVETLTSLTYDSTTGLTEVLSDVSLYGGVFGSASFSLDTDSLASMTKFYRSPDVNDYFMSIYGAATPNNVLSNHVSTQNTTLGQPIIFNRSSDDVDIYTSFDSFSDYFSLNMQITGSNPIRTYGSDGSYTDVSDYFYTSLYLYGDLSRTSFENTLLATGFNNFADGGYVVQGHYHYANHFDAAGELLNADTLLNMQQIYFSANELSVNIEENTANVPEPHTIWLMGIGLLGLGLRQRRHLS